MVYMAGLCLRRVVAKGHSRGETRRGNLFLLPCRMLAVGVFPQRTGPYCCAQPKAVAMLRVFPQRRKMRRGTTAVETALVLPVFLLFVLGIVELGRAVFVEHVLNSACRQAARIGSTNGNSTATVKTKLLDILGSAVNRNAVQVFVKDASSFDSGAPSTTSTALESMPSIEVSSAQPRQLFMVRAKIRYHDIAIVNNIPILGKFLDGVTLEGQAFMRHE
jgi:hypothetical protein